MTKLKFGAFIAPFHGLAENPTLALERDFELVEHMDRLGFDEAWIGEHHSGGMELIASPDLFIAAAAQRTRHIRFATGVASLPYHHPLMLAERINFLDHITRGRVTFGVGPGALPTDAWMLGIPVSETRNRMDEALDVLVPLMRGETVTRKTDWFELDEARLQMNPYSQPSIPMAVASVASPGGAVAAGRYGLGLISIAATMSVGFNALQSSWALAEQSAAKHGQTVDRSTWSVVGPMHIAETREQAREEVRFGIEEWVRYYSEVAALPIVPEGAEPIQAMIDSQFAIIGTPADAIAQIERLQSQSGGFGTYLQFDTNWADWGAKKRSYEMIARYVMPHFQNANVNRQESWSWAAARREDLIVKLQQGVAARTAQHIADHGSDNISPAALASSNAGVPK